MIDRPDCIVLWASGLGFAALMVMSIAGVLQ